MNFLSKEPVQFHMQSDYIFPEVDFRTCCYSGVSFQRKANKIMDTLGKTKVCCAIQEMICWSAASNAISVIKNSSVIMMEVFNESQRQE